MNRDWLMPAKILTGTCMLAVSSFSQTYTISAKPGAVNFIEGEVSVNGDPVWTSNLKSTFLNANDLIAVGKGRAEVLLTPGVFLRLGENAQVRMLKPALIETQVEIISGESMIEVDDMVAGSSVAVVDHGSSTTLTKPGLFRFTEHNIAALEGKADVVSGDRKIEIKKNKQAGLDGDLKLTKLDLSEGDDLYAWSNIRAQYNAAATYAGSREAYNAGGYGYSSSFSSPGWYWNSPFNSFMWMPANGAFYSPFGWGFYGPGVVAYAPVISFPYGYGYGGYGYGGYGGLLGGGFHPRPPLVLPVNPNKPGVASIQGNSPAAFAAARQQMQQAVAYQGLRTASGAPAASLRNGQVYTNMRSASQAAAASAHTSAASSAGASSAGSGGGWHGNSSGSFSSSASSAGAVSHGSGGGHSSK